MRRASQTVGRPRVDGLSDVLQFMRALWAVVQALQRTSKRMEQRLGVTGPQRLVVRVVGLFPGVSAGDLARMLHIHPSTLTGVLHRLGKQGLLKRDAAMGDRRRAVLRLTPAGARMNAQRHGTVEAAVEKSLETISARQRATTQRALILVVEALDAVGAAQPANSRRKRHVRLTTLTRS